MDLERSDRLVPVFVDPHAILPLTVQVADVGVSMVPRRPDAPAQIPDVPEPAVPAAVRPRDGGVGDADGVGQLPAVEGRDDADGAACGFFQVVWDGCLG